ncbi:MAG: glycosyltransferase family 4 protein [Solirubrobacteraceae bacterium]|nr:glycosyltransferase family 4 protein [Solirubrobacteraceae bacterium]
MEVVARDLLRAMIDHLPADMELTAIVNHRGMEAAGPWQELEMAVADVDIKSRPAWVAAEAVAVPRLAKRLRADVVHSLGNLSPVTSPMPRGVTVHDLIHHRARPAGLAAHSRITGTLVGLSARRADRVVAISQQTSADLQAVLGISRDQIDVIPNGVAPPTVAPTTESELRSRLNLGDRPLIFSPSARQPHKNIDRLIDAHALLPASRPLLVLPGYTTGRDDLLRKRAGALGIGADIRMLGWIDQADLEGLYLASRALVFPSLYEGFGLPVIEAMLRGLPVACSGRGALAEVAGDAALMFDPENPAAIAAAISRLLADDQLREHLITAGRKRAEQFTWERSAQGYFDTFRRLAAGASA